MFLGHINTPLIISLSIFDDIWNRDSSNAVSLDFGNLTGKKIMGIEEWRPKIKIR